MHPLYQAVCDKFLSTTNWFWSGHKKTFAVSKPQIMNTVCFSIGPGATCQPLHRDDWCYHVVAQKADKYPDDLQRDTGIGFFVAGKKATFENGCTRFIPGSHLWEHEREPDDDLCAYAELEKGTLMPRDVHAEGLVSSTDFIRRWVHDVCFVLPRRWR